MLSIVSDFLSGLPPLIKELLLLAIGLFCIVAAFKGGSLREKAMGVVA